MRWISKEMSNASYARGPNGERLCRWCREPVPPPRRTFCGDNCIHEWKLRTDWKYLRDCVFERDRGICALCGTDCVALRRQPREALRAIGYTEGDLRRKTFWDADHILSVSESGGLASLENYQSLCVLCHRVKTAKLRKK